MDYRTYLRNYPDQNGRFGPYGGAYLSDELKPAFEEITEAYQTICHSSQFINELRRIRREFQGRPTPVSHLERLSNSLGNVQLYVKREALSKDTTQASRAYTEIIDRCFSHVLGILECSDNKQHSQDY